ncbi:MAG TPA: LamG domain-containing protein [Planctomycetota bacterium]|nr:LamG domain-containing protein [Planctomycetota bacterium]
MIVRSLTVPLCLTVSAVAQLSPTVALWPLDATSGTTVTDVGPYGNHGTLVNFGAAPWVVGQFGNALQFDGVDDYVAITSSFDLPIYRLRAAPFSVAFWINAPAQSDRRVYSEQDSAPAGLGPLFTLGSGSTAAGATNRLRVYIRTDAAILAVDGLSNGTVFDSTWHHVVYVDDVGRVRIYIDGALDSSFDYSRWSYGPAGTLAGSYQEIDSVTLGAVVRNGSISAPLLGTIDELQVYRAALDLSDAQAIFGGAGPNLVVGSLGAFGQGCGPGPLDMIATGSASFGQTIWLQAARGTPNGALLLGLSSGLVSPLELTVLGYPGCTLYLPSLDLVVAGIVGPAGSAPPVGVPVPNQAQLNGAFFTAQWINVLPATFELSPAAVMQLGR